MAFALKLCALLLLSHAVRFVDAPATEGVPQWVQQLGYKLCTDNGVQFKSHLCPIQSLQLVIQGVKLVESLPGFCRDLHVLDLFNGKGWPGFHSEARGFRVAYFDLLNHYTEDFCEFDGLLHCAILATRIVPTGGAMMGPQCSSWVWMSRGTTKRKKGDLIFGNEDLPFVQTANIMAMFVSAFLTHNSP